MCNLRFAYLEHECATYQLPDVVAFDSDPLGPPMDSDYFVVPFKGRRNNAVLFRNASCLEALVSEAGLFINGPFPHSTVFVHRRVTDDGRSWIVVIQLIYQKDGANEDAVWAYVTILKPGGFERRFEYEVGYEGSSIDLHHRHLTVLLGYPDPADPAGIILPYTVDDKRYSFRTRIQFSPSLLRLELRDSVAFD